MLDKCLFLIAPGVNAPPGAFVKWINNGAVLCYGMQSAEPVTT